MKEKFNVLSNLWGSFNFLRYLMETLILKDFQRLFYLGSLHHNILGNIISNQFCHFTFVKENCSNDIYIFILWNQFNQFSSFLILYSSDNVDQDRTGALLRKFSIFGIETRCWPRSLLEYFFRFVKLKKDVLPMIHQRDLSRSNCYFQSRF